MPTACAAGFGGGLELKQGQAVDFSGHCLGGGRQSWSPAGHVFLPGHVRGCRLGGIGRVLKPKAVTGQGFSQAHRGPPGWGRVVRWSRGVPAASPSAASVQGLGGRELVCLTFKSKVLVSHHPLALKPC